MHHKEWYSEASHMATKFGTTPSMPRLAGRQTLKTIYLLQILKSTTGEQ